MGIHLKQHKSLGKHVTAILFVLQLLLKYGHANQMDPHVYPKHGPFFEGWYLRIIDQSQNVSLGFLFGRVEPAHAGELRNSSACQNSGSGCLHSTGQPTPDRSQTEKTGLPLVYASLLLNLHPQSKLDTPGGYFSPELYKVTKNGKPVSEDPDDISPPQFEASIGVNVSFTVTPNHTQFQIQLGDHLLTGYTFRPVPWGPNGAGPESFLEKFHLPVHWFVYSLSSQVRYYKYMNLATGEVVIGRSTPGSPVIAHMEKNWGKSFPKAWVWAEGVDPVANVSFAFSAGIITEFKIDVKAQLSGYRNPGKEITCSFHPLNSVHSLEHNGCAGTATLKVDGLDCAVTFVLTASPDSFSSCLAAPGAAGFQQGCVESYTATADITVFQRKGGSMVLSDRHTITMAALEFGAAYMCNGCAGSRNNLHV